MKRKLLMQSDTFPSWMPRAAALRNPAFPTALRGRVAHGDVAPLRSGEKLLVEALEFAPAGAYRKQWRDLAARALEPTLFNEPACALTAAQHLAAPHQPRFVFVWEPVGDVARGELIAVCALQVPGRFGGRGLVHTWTHEQVPLAIPLIDASRALAALDALEDFCAGRRPRAAGMVFHGLPEGGKTAVLLERWAQGRKRAIALRHPSASASLQLGAGGRFCLRSAIGFDAATFASLRRHIENDGAVAFTSLLHPSDVRFATEEFLRLDAASGLAGKDRLLARADVATFTRTLTRLLAAEGRCRIDRLAVDGQPIAMGIVFAQQDRHFLWRVACDPAYDPAALHGQFVLGVLRTHPRAPAMVLADHRGGAHCPGLARVWPFAIPLVNAAVSLGENRGRALVSALGRDAARGRIMSVLGALGSRQGAPVRTRNRGEP